MSIETVAEMISKSILDRNPGILKAGLVELAAKQGVTVKSKMIFFAGIGTDFDLHVDQKVEKLVKDKGYRLHHLDAIILIVDLQSVVKGAMINGPIWGSYFNGNMGYGMPSNNMAGFNAPGYIVMQNEIIVFSDITPDGYDFRLFDELSEIYNQVYGQMNDPCYRGSAGAAPSPSTCINQPSWNVPS